MSGSPARKVLEDLYGDELGNDRGGVFALSGGADWIARQREALQAARNGSYSEPLQSGPEDVTRFETLSLTVLNNRSLHRIEVLLKHLVRMQAMSEPAIESSRGAV